MKRLIVLVDDDAQFCDAFREYLTYRDYDCLVYHDSRSAFNGILRKMGTIWGIVVDLELVGSPEQGDVLIDLLRTNGITEPIVVLTNDVSVRSEQALLASLPALICYLALLAYMHIGNLRPLADAVVVTSVLVITAVLTILMTKIKIAWWLRRKRLALARLAVILVSMFVSTLIVLLLATT